MAAGDYAVGRSYRDADGAFHMNAAAVYNDADADISASLEVLNSTAAAELSFVDGATAGAALASKAVVLDSSSMVQGIKKTVEIHTTGDTLTVAESGSLHNTAGALGAVTFVLPAAVPGLEYFFHVGAAQELRIDPDGTETVALPSSGVQGAAGKYLTANAIGESVHIVCSVSGTWTVFGFTGTWTAEA